MDKAIRIIEEMIEEQKIQYLECKDGRTTRMKNNDSRNWGMVDAENRIEHYNEVKIRLRKAKVSGSDKTGKDFREKK